MVDRFVEDWWPTCGLVESSADVDPSARVHDSVVLRGSRVRRGAVLVRSVVCPGAVVRNHEIVVGRLVAGRRTKGLRAA